MMSQKANVLQSFGKTREPDLRLFCFPYAGSNSHLFSSWNRSMPNEVEIIGVNYWVKGLPNEWDMARVAKPTALVQLAREISVAIVPFLDAPFALFGHSMGGLLAYEVYFQILELCRVRPRALFLSGTRAPHNTPANFLHQMDDDHFRQKLLDLNGLPQEIVDSPELFSRALRRLRVDFAACESYRRPSYEPISVPITVFHGKKDKFLTLKDSDDWREHAGNGYSLKLLDGDHFFIHSQEQALLSMVREAVL